MDEDLPEKVKRMNKSMKRLLIVTTTTVEASSNLPQILPRPNFPAIWFKGILWR